MLNKKILLFICLLLNSCSFLSEKGLVIKESINQSNGNASSEFYLKNKKFKTQWAKNLDPSYDSGNLPLALNSPGSYKGILFAGSGSGKMTAYELLNGREVWQSNDNGYYHQKPVFFEDHVIYGTIEGRIYSRHYLTGKIQFEVDLDSSIESPAIISGGRLFVHLRNHKIFALDAKTGKILWAYRRSVPYLTTVQRVSSPTVIGNRLYIGFADGVIAAFAVEDGNLLWEQKLSRALKFLDVDSTPVMFNGSLVVGSLAGKLSVLNPESGQIKKSIELSVSRAPIKYKDGLIISSTEGLIVFVDREFTEKKRLKLSDRPIGNMKIEGDQLFVGTLDGRFVEMNLNSWEQSRTHYLGHAHSAIFGEIDLGKKHAAFISSRYRLYVLSL